MKTEKLDFYLSKLPINESALCFAIVPINELALCFVVVSYKYFVMTYDLDILMFMNHDGCHLCFLQV